MLRRDDLPAALADFGGAAAAALLLVVYLALAEPYVGLVLHRRFEAAARSFSDARRWLYRRLLLLEWMLAALCVATVLLAPGVGPGVLGLRLPTAPLGIGLSAFAVLAAGALLWSTMRMVARADPHEEPAGGEPVLAMLPRVPVERRLFTLVALTAGFCEELVFRGFVIIVLAVLVPAAPVWVLVVISSVIFGLAHIYQGATGVTASLLIGLALGTLYVLTGSLIAPMLVHALIDLRAIPLGRLIHRVPQHA